GELIAVDLDARLAENLRKIMAGRNITIVEADALKVNWVELIKLGSAFIENPDFGKEMKARVRVVANLPYYISTPIIGRLMGLGRSVFDMTLMLQNEIVDRIISEPGSKDYGYLSVLVQYHCIAKKLFEVPPSAFVPQPKVQSAVVHLAVRSRPEIAVSDEESFFALVRAAFAQRRKTILNNLKASAVALCYNSDPQTALD